MSKAKKFIVLAMACIMLFGSTLTAHAACSHVGGAYYGGSSTGWHCVHCAKCDVHLSGTVCYKPK